MSLRPPSRPRNTQDALQNLRRLRAALPPHECSPWTGLEKEWTFPTHEGELAPKKIASQKKTEEVKTDCPRTHKA